MLFFIVVDDDVIGFTGCCIYHKNRQFAESDSDESDSDVEIAAHQPRKPDQPPNYQRFHA